MASHRLPDALSSVDGAAAASRAATRRDIRHRKRRDERGMWEQRKRDCGMTIEMNFRMLSIANSNCSLFSCAKGVGCFGLPAACDRRKQKKKKKKKKKRNSAMTDTATQYHNTNVLSHLTLTRSSFVVVVVTRCTVPRSQVPILISRWWLRQQLLKEEAMRVALTASAM
jgi:hypothetical protein